MQRSLILFLLILVSACVHQPDKAPPTPEEARAEAGQAFARLTDEIFAHMMAESPSLATAIGIHTYDDKLDDRSRAAIDRQLTDLKAFAQKLAAIDGGLLKPDDQIDSRALAAHIQSEIYQIETLRTWEKNPMSYTALPGGAVDGLIKRNFAPAKERLVKVIARLNQIPNVYQAARENVKNPPKEFTDLAIRMAQGSVGFFAKSLPLWAKEAAGGDKLLWKKFQIANQNAVEETRMFTEWLKKDLLPRSKGSYAIGAEAFQTILKYDEMIETPLPEILKIGEAQLEKDHAAFIATAKLIDPKKTPAQVMRQLSSEHPTATDLIPSVKRTLEEARQYLITKDLVTIPSEVRPTVEETPPYARSGTFASMDTPGPEETKATEAFYYVTPVEPSWTRQHQDEHLRAYNPYVVAMVNVHEAFPGHFLQFLYASKFPTKTRRMISSSSNSEGWAHYTEQMMVDQGFGNGSPKIRLAQLQEALLRDCRFIVGIKLHTEGWTVEQGAQLFVQKGFQEPANAYEEARRGAYNPTYLYYTLGKIEIQKLRDEYLAKTGHTLKQFHDAFVTQGALPIPLIREILLRP